MPYNEQDRAGRWYGAGVNADELRAWQPDAAPAAPSAEAEPQAPESETVAPEATAAPYYQPKGSAPYIAMPPNPQTPAHRRRGRIALIVCGVVILAALSFALGRLGSIDVRINSFGNERAERAEPWTLLPEEEAELPDSVEEYFESYFSGTDDILIPSTTAREGLQLPLERTQGAELSLQEIYQKLNPAVVGIVTYLDDEEYSWGTGVLFTADGYLITNAHVLAGSEAALVRCHDGKEYEAELIGSDDATDLAVLKIDGKNLPFATFADSADCRVGDEVVAIGNPLGENYSGTMTNGIISAIDRHVSNNGYDMTLLQTNAALNEGNSGGPLINRHGQIIGITNMKIMYSYYATVEGIGFAIPSAVVREVVDQLLAHGHVLGKPALGIVAGAVSAEAMQGYDMPQGVYVTEVHKNSDAHAQGLRAGDVITKVNGTPVTTVSEVNALKEGLSVGDSITVEVFRNGDLFELSFELVDSSTVQ